MKRFRYVLPALLLLGLASCGDDEATRNVPNDPITLQPATIDNPALDAPAQLTQHPDDNIAWYPEIGGVCMPYDNGQNITYVLGLSTTASGEEFYYATVRLIEGTAKNVVIPETLQWTYNRVPTTFAVTGFDLAIVTEGDKGPVADGIESITLPAACAPKGSSAGLTMNESFNMMLCSGKNLKNVYLQEGYQRFCSINGAVYTADGKQLVAVPSGRTGHFTAAEGTETVASGAFRHCEKIDVVTLPSTIKAIENEAFLWTKELLAINILSAEAPTAPEYAFGHYARACVLRVMPEALASYSAVEPVEPVEPTEPEMPADDASDDEWDAYDAAMAVYDAEMAEYNAAMRDYEKALDRYNNLGGYKTVSKVEAWNFQIN